MFMVAVATSFQRYFPLRPSNKQSLHIVQMNHLERWQINFMSLFIFWKLTWWNQSPSTNIVWSTQITSKIEGWWLKLVWWLDVFVFIKSKLYSLFYLQAIQLITVEPEILKAHFNNKSLSAKQIIWFFSPA